MECAQPAGRQPLRQWREALNVIRACTVSAGDGLPQSTSHVAIEIPHEVHSHADPDAAAVHGHFFTIRGLVKDKCDGSFRRLGGSTGIAAKLTSHPERGISDDATPLLGHNFLQRRKEFGQNRYPKPRPKSFLRHVLDALSDVFIVALLVCAVVSLGFGIKDNGLKDGWYDGASIFLVVFVVSGVTGVISHSQAKRDHKLATESADVAVNVVRAARRQEVSVFVVGDVVILKIGDAVPADGVFLDGHGLQVDESCLTGLPVPIKIEVEKNPFLASGVKVVHGHGSMLVTAIGTDTSSWSSHSTLKLNTHPAPLEERLDSLISTIGKVGVVVVLVGFTVLIARHFTSSSTGKPLLFEKGVPLAVTLMITFSMKRMCRRLVMSTLALSTDKPTNELMDCPPIDRTVPLVNNAMWHIMSAQALFRTAVLLALQYLGIDDEASGTMIFNVFMLFQVFNEFNMRDIEKKNVVTGVLKNRMFLVIIALTLVLQMVTVEVLTRFVGTTKLGLGQWGVCLTIAAVAWPVGWAVKFIPVPVRSS